MKIVIFSVLLATYSSSLFAAAESLEQRAYRAFNCPLSDQGETLENAQPTYAGKMGLSSTHSKTIAAEEGTYVLNSASNIFLISEFSNDVVRDQKAIDFLAWHYVQVLDGIFNKSGKITSISHADFDLLNYNCKGLSADLDNRLLKIKALVK